MRRVYTMRQKHATCDCGKIALCKPAYCDMRLSQESWMISTFLRQHATVACRTNKSVYTARFCCTSHQFCASCKRTFKFAQNKTLCAFWLSWELDVLAVFVAFDEGERILIMSFFEINPVCFTRRSRVYRRDAIRFQGLDAILGCWVDGWPGYQWHR